ncbi:putative glyoxalase superfamily protein PhnB [Saccharothrix tamanrassetensis]|uniref:Putative glyoxalase superfamily protein PhnB n=1 Tax=Saccharothrix tamanrassetensis TaxID=1051531 RepID=A0A841CBI5_9PSEU|nr:VOC family protein [Saccharothrix tamanrassetensis]MBB5953537.1 putative glyoxalase superfamily protein PhnB [Saccharothrix tamanrassetensis]
MTSLHVYLGYRDADAAIEWLGKAFGFEATMRFPDEQGGVAHSELRRGDAALVVFSDRDGYERAPRKGDTGGLGVYVAVDDDAEVDGLYARAVGAGGVTVWEPASTEWGNYRFRVIDPEGFEWTFGTHRPGQPQQW